MLIPSIIIIIAVDPFLSCRTLNVHFFVFETIVAGCEVEVFAVLDRRGNSLDSCSAPHILLLLIGFEVISLVVIVAVIVIRKKKLLLLLLLLLLSLLLLSLSLLSLSISLL